MTRAVFLRLLGLLRGARLSIFRLTAKPSVGTTVPVVVSLTSYPARIDTVWKVIASIGLGSVVPERIVLVLAESQFPGRVLPVSVLESAAEVLWVDVDSRSYKKLLPVAELVPDLPIVTADDDCLYGRNWLIELWRAHCEYPESVVGWRGAAIRDVGGVVAPYDTWAGATTRTPSELVFLKGDGGILYPPLARTTALMDVARAMSLCPSADDVWFKVCTLAERIDVRRISSKRFDVPTIPGTQSAGLRDQNVAELRNDAQLRVALRSFGLPLISSEW